MAVPETSEVMNMKLTLRELKQIIKEEIDTTMVEIELEEASRQGAAKRRKRHSIIAALKKKKKIKSPYAVYRANLEKGYDIPEVPPRGSDDDSGE